MSRRPGPVSKIIQPASGSPGRRSLDRMLRGLSSFVTIASSLALLAVSAVCVAPCGAVDVRIAQLEAKFFRHDYPNDDPRHRLDRLEKMVFGVTRTGSEEDRLSRLLSAVPSLDAEPSPERIPGVRSSASQKSRAAQPGGAPEPKIASTTPSTYSSPASSKYPAVTAME